MSLIEVVRVETRSQRRRFMRLPEEVHEKNPLFIPRIRANESELAGFFHHPFYSNAESQAFIAVSHGLRQGRIVAIDNSVHREKFPNDKSGFIGFFDCTNDQDIADTLFDCGAEWLKSRGCPKMRGPVSPSMNYEAGLLVEGFEKNATFMMPYNPEYYVALWEGYGFKKAQDMYAFAGNKREYRNAPQKALDIGRRACERFGATFRRLNRRQFVSDVQLFLELYNTASSGTWGFVPFTAAEIKFLARELKHLIVPELTCFMEIDGKTVGAAFGLLDYNPIVQRIRGRLFPFGFLWLLMGRKKLKRARCMSINILPEYQRWGLGISLLHQFLQQAEELGLDEMEFSYVLESNHLAAATLTKAGVNREKSYRVYEKEI